MPPIRRRNALDGDTVARGVWSRGQRVTTRDRAFDIGRRSAAIGYLQRKRQVLAGLEWSKRESVDRLEIKRTLGLPEVLEYPARNPKFAPAHPRTRVRNDRVVNNHRGAPDCQATPLPDAKGDAANQLERQGCRYVDEQLNGAHTDAFRAAFTACGNWLSRFTRRSSAGARVLASRARTTPCQVRQHPAPHPAARAPVWRNRTNG